MLPNGWRLLTVDSFKAKVRSAIAVGPFGSRLKSDLYVSTGIPVLRGANISDTRQLDGDFVYVAPETADQLSSSNVFPDDLFFPHRGLIGSVGIVPRNACDRYLLSSSLMKLTCDRSQVDPLYVFYFFRSARGRHELLKHASTVGTPGIGQPLASLRSIAVPIPPLTEQRTIARVLGALDDKIELNRHTAETLEHIAHALFRSWFVDFDSSGGAIPDDWDVQPLAAVAEVVGGGTPRTSEAAYWGGRIPWFSVVDAPSLSEVWVLETEKTITAEGVINSATRVLPVGTTILSARGTVGKVALVGVPMAMNQSCYGLQPKTERTSAFVYYCTRQAVATLQQRAHGSVFDTITRNTLAGTRLPVPPVDVMQAFEDRAMPLLERIRAGLHESRTLAALRDTLLPKLLSGELRVPDAERLAAARV